MWSMNELASTTVRRRCRFDRGGLLELSTEAPSVGLPLEVRPGGKEKTVRFCLAPPFLRYGVGQCGDRDEQRQDRDCGGRDADLFRCQRPRTTR